MTAVKTVLLCIIMVLLGVGIVNLKIFKLSPVDKSGKLSSIVRLVKDGRTFCSGVVVNEHTIITASHCVIENTEFGPMMNQDQIEIRIADNRPLGVTAKAYNVRVQLDQALLMGDFRRFQPRRVITRIHDLIKIGRYDQTLITCGYPLGGPLYCGKMYFQDLTDFMWATKGLLLPGMSGGPVMLEDGTVVAVNIAVGGNLSVVSPIYDYDLEFVQGKK